MNALNVRETTLSTIFNYKMAFLNSFYHSCPWLPKLNFGKEVFESQTLLEKQNLRHILKTQGRVQKKCNYPQFTPILQSTFKSPLVDFPKTSKLST